MAPFTLTRAEVREFDRRAIEEFGVPGIVLMENAGRGCAELLMRLNPEKKPVVILCGTGNNGGDGFVIARHLDNHGWPVQVHYAWLDDHHPVGLPADAETNFRIIANSRIERLKIIMHLMDYMHLKQIVLSKCWLVDALFGTGISRPLSSPFDELVAQVNASRNPVFAIDIPSGLDCDTGEPLGPTMRATHTATFVAPKRGFLNPTSRAWTGEVHVIDIGVPRVLIEEYRARGGA